MNYRNLTIKKKDGIDAVIRLFSKSKIAGVL
jgi:hypothetical protein